jgi:SAM-dependent methyltransferase
MNDTNRAHEDQSARWNGAAGQAWVDEQETLDRMFQPFEDLLVDSVSGNRVLDVGCGAGAVTLAIGRKLGPQGQCVGIDISQPLIDAARDRAARAGATATFLRADAQRYAFEPATFDAIVSRFGIMFFDDSVRAFENLRRAARTDAALRFLAWRSPAENPFMTTTERAAAPFLPNLPPRQPDAPGQFAFADPDRVRRILEESGWAEVDILPVDVACTLPGKDLIRFVTRLGPLGTVIHEADEPTRARVFEALHAAFAPYFDGAEVRYTAACWMVAAKKIS